MGDKERLRQALLQDMKHWSVDTLKEAINYIDGMVLSMDGDDFLWWWDLRKDVYNELIARRIMDIDILLVIGMIIGFWSLVIFAYRWWF